MFAGVVCCDGEEREANECDGWSDGQRSDESQEEADDPCESDEDLEYGRQHDGALDLRETMSFNVNARVEPNFISHQPRRQKFYFNMRTFINENNNRLVTISAGLELVRSTGPRNCYSPGRLTQDSLQVDDDDDPRHDPVWEGSSWTLRRWPETLWRV